MSTDLFIGIDPGVGGAVAWICGTELQCWDIPTFEIKVNGKKRRQIDIHTLTDQLAPLADLGPDLVVIEEVHAMPKQGVTSSFSFGFTAGALQGVVVALGMPIKLVHPRVWKKHYGLTADKDASRRMASRLMPQGAAQWPLKKHDGRAEAVLLALYGEQT